MKVLGLAGPSGSGKTTLLIRLIGLIQGRGLSVSTIKHTHHGVDMDRPGKDTHRARTAGAREVLLCTPERFVLQHQYGPGGEPPLDALLARLNPVDVVLVEGFRPYPHPKILVHRAAAHRPLPAWSELPGLIAVASDTPIADAPVPLFDLDDADGLVAFALTHLGLALPETAP